MKEEKIRKMVLEKELQDSIEVEELTVNLLVEGKPENYVRERVVHGHAYNPKSKQMDETRQKCLHQLSKKDYDFIKRTIEESEYYAVEITAVYYCPIPKGDTIKMAALKEAGLLTPSIRIDLDNYDKFILDSLHDVLYDDDKHVSKISSKKLYSLQPRTEITAVIKNIKIKKE